VRTQIKHCTGERTRHLFRKVEAACVMCGAPNPKLDPNRNRKRGRPRKYGPGHQLL
jgi:hypothetical protein